MADANFQDLLSQPVSEVSRPKPLPVGSYVFMISDFKFDESRQKKTKFVQFVLKPVMALDDVDQSELSESLGDKTLSDKEFKQDFYLTGDAIWRLDEFLLESVGTTADTPRMEQINEAKGQQVRGYISHQPSARDANMIYANISQFTKHED